MRLISLAILFLLSSIALSAGAPAVAHDHPILGTWVFTDPQTGCAETYRFRSDGTLLVTSAEEVTESRYEIAARAAPSGFYRWVDTITKDNGKKDCSGNLTKVGDKATNYILFDAAKDSAVVCREEKLDVCFGPLQRAHGQSS